MTLNPSLDLNLVDIIEAIEPNNKDPVIDAKMIIGIVINEKLLEPENTGNAMNAIKAALTNPTIPIVTSLLRI